jgi:hypothetical protein
MKTTEDKIIKLLRTLNGSKENRTKKIKEQLILNNGLFGEIIIDVHLRVFDVISCAGCGAATMTDHMFQTMEGDFCAGCYCEWLHSFESEAEEVMSD